DEITITKNFKITPGIRVDYSYLGSQPPLDPLVNTTNEYKSANPTYNHTAFGDINNKWLGKATVSPRFGFNYDVKGNQSLVVRGGTGIFTGRMPFAWLGYAYTLTGSTYGTIDYRPSYSSTLTSVGLAIDPSKLKDTINKYSPSAASTREVDLIDNNFKLPTVWRSNVAVDIKFGKGYKLTLDALYTKTVYDVKFQQINLRDSSTFYPSGPTQTPWYLGSNQKNNTVFSNAYFLSNTKEGYRYNLTAQISKAGNKTKFGSNHFIALNYSVAYTYGRSKDVSNGIRNSFQSNYEVNPAVNAENAQLASSNFDLRHRIVGSLGLNAQWNKTNNTTLGFVFSKQSGSPFSYIYNPSVNAFRNGSNANLAFIPATTSATDFRDYTLNGSLYTASQQSTDFNNFVSNDKYLSSRKGQYAERNGAHTPWNSTLDMKLMHEFKFSFANNKTVHSLQFSVDVLNVLNLINNDWGHINFVTNINNYTVNILRFANDNSSAKGIAPGVSGSAGNYTPTYNFAPPSTSNGKYYTLDPINSRWQGQLGIRYSF
ncbi:MAG: TonB-dependent receptor, partial [Deinococcales bacterium]|nr:TonB-dependent receptor [Chitinophagaceae bacterium]